MGNETSFFMVLIAGLVGFVVSVLIERLLEPRVPLYRSWAAWALHIGLWFMLYSFLVLVLGRPWFVTVLMSALLLTVVLVNNAKFRALQEPFVFQDYEYFTDAIRYPRLYIPFFGWGKFLAAIVGFVLAISLGVWVEVVPSQRFEWDGQMGGSVVLLFVGLMLFLSAKIKKLPVSFDPKQDLQSLGLLAFLWRYAEEEQKKPVVSSPFNSLSTHLDKDKLPHLVAVQSESFFDPRQLYSGIRADVLAALDEIKLESVVSGRLEVPSWGANTVRSEFAFLCGMDEEDLGVYRFNPYRAVASGWQVESIAGYLKRLGYLTICIHPYVASFYRRDRVLPKLGFDEFIDINFFDDSERSGPYISDRAISNKIDDFIKKAKKPVFIFAITMENHGPLHLERVNTSDIEALYDMPPPSGCHDLTVYLRHLRNADSMVAQLRKILKSSLRPASLCWFGDHVPIMPAVYECFGMPSGKTEYFIWKNKNSSKLISNDLKINELSITWLEKVFGFKRCEVDPTNCTN